VARRSDIDPLALLPFARHLRSLIERHIDAGLSKFVIRPAASVRSWKDEVQWLARAIPDLQT
jgi:hypothetical protein